MGVGQENLYFPGSWCYFDFVGNTTGNRVMSYIYALIGISILSVTSTINAITIYRIWRDPDRLRYLEDTRRISGSLDSHVMIFISAVTVVFVILWTPLIVVVFLHAANIRNENNEVELWFLRMTVCNAIVDPWLYIVLRKESLEKIIYILRQCTGNPSQENEALIS
ncbi:thromboxane A2 receptor-like [Saccostrea cucullata]|uniref:thromboxane A2 receptor-like n=1 Tax=Saccostrea cuccullata TaxID=36930 RepID=UPI002ED5D3AA